MIMPSTETVTKLMIRLTTANTRRTAAPIMNLRKGVCFVLLGTEERARVKMSREIIMKGE